jgi:malate dehydrogenase (oxaloacetate-decarboxylating)(NADP+)
MSIQKEEALNYHSRGRKGKIEVIASKPCFTSRELSLAYTPGVAEPCREIYANDDDVYKYTAKGNLVAVVSNGTAVLGLGDIGPHAGKPVMEGKGVLFKRFADIDVFDIELKTKDPKEIIKTCQFLEPTFGGINLEDIKAPECFEIEEELKKTMNIPVFHDDQHGTAIISCAALINACEIADKKVEDLKIVVSGAGAAAVACCNTYIMAGVKRENIAMFDSKGLINKKRTDLNKYKMDFAIEKEFKDLGEALLGADVFIGLSKADVLTQEWLKGMADNPIVFAMANPDPEITYEKAIEAREDVIMATGRSDYPNQVNNVLGFPFIFRGALDVRAQAINEEMKMAAVKALADLAKEKVPEMVLRAYGDKDFSFGREYIIPKPFDPRVLWNVAPAVAKAAMATGVARHSIEDWEAYENELKERLGYSQEIIRMMINKARKNPKKIIYTEGEEEKVIRAANTVFNENIGKPILIGHEKVIIDKIKELGFDEQNFQIVDPRTHDKREEYIKAYYELRKRKGVTLQSAKTILRQSNYYGAVMLNQDDAQVLIGGLGHSYPTTIQPALRVIGVKEGLKVVSGLYIVIIKRKVFFFADTTVNFNPNSEELAQIAISAADTVKEFDIVPKIALLSFSNFGSVKHPEALLVRRAAEIVNELRPDLEIDGEMQADTAVVTDILRNEFPFSKLKSSANVLVFPNLSAGNIAYKLFERLTSASVIGPVLMGMKKPIHVLQRDSTVEDIINMSAIAVVDAKYS